MKKIPLERLAATATIVESGQAPATRRQRLDRWRDLLLAEPERLLRPLWRLEHRKGEDRVACRADNSPIAIAWADPVLRAAGLAGDTVGHAEAFFDLSSRQSHYLLCDCHYLGHMSSRRVAGRIDAIAQTNPFAKAWLLLRGT
jgi:hypothetical protein